MSKRVVLRAVRIHDGRPRLREIVDGSIAEHCRVQLRLRDPLEDSLRWENGAAA